MRKIPITSVPAIIVALVSLLSNVLGATDMKTAALRCEHLPRPLGVDVPNPRLSWQLVSDQRGQKQTAWHVLVASSREKLDENTGDLWDSGKVEGDQSLNVIYGGAPLQSRRQYFWKVMVWDMTIRNNKFIRCGEPVVNISPRNTVPNNGVHQNIRIEENEFVLRGTTAVRAKSAKGLRVVGNTIRAGEKLDAARAVQTKECAEVVVEGNVFQRLEE